MECFHVFPHRRIFFLCICTWIRLRWKVPAQFSLKRCSLFCLMNINERLNVFYPSVTSAALPSQKGLCDFEQGLCGWTLDPDSDLGWVLHTSSKTTALGQSQDLSVGSNSEWYTHTGSYLVVKLNLWTTRKMHFDTLMWPDSFCLHRSARHMPAAWNPERENGMNDRHALSPYLAKTLAVRLFPSHDTWQLEAHTRNKARL